MTGDFTALGAETPDDIAERERKAFNARRPPKARPSEIADHAWASLTCRNCGSEPRSACIAKRESWRTVCKERYADAAIELSRIRREAHPTWETLEALARAEIAEQVHEFMSDVPPEHVTARVRQWIAEGRYR